MNLSVISENRSYSFKCPPANSFLFLCLFLICNETWIWWRTWIVCHLETLSKRVHV